MGKLEDKSYNKINYGVRISKAIERKMMMDIFQRLNVLYPINKYRYVGFGSTSFIDFILVHKQLGIHDLHSIEWSETDQERFNFNCPYACIKIHFGDAGNMLTKVGLDQQSIVWLDYDKKPQNFMFNDLATLVNLCTGPSVVSITYNSETSNKRTGEEDLKEKKQEIVERIGKHLPLDIKNRKILGQKHVSLLYHEVFTNFLNTKVAERNLNRSTKISAKQIFYFQYRDGATMSTIGWLIDDANTINSNLVKMALTDYDFYKPKNFPYIIEVPNLTRKEIRLVEEAIPSGLKRDGSFKKIALSKLNIPKEEVIKYRDLYKYYPHFYEIYA